MPDPKVTPQILKCAEAMAEYAKDCWCPQGDEIVQVDEDGGQDIDEDKVEKRVIAGFSALICEHTGAEMMPVLDRELLEWHDNNCDCRLKEEECSTLQLLIRLAELGYGEEEKDEQ